MNKKERNILPLQPSVSLRQRGEASRASKRIRDDADKALSKFELNNSQKQFSVQNDQLTITFLGGLDEVGEKNMAVIEYGDQAVILDCGINLAIDLPGVNYAINDMTYLDQIKKNIRAYIITHGHLDHIGGLKHTVPLYPAPIYGSRYTIGVIERSFQDEQLNINSKFVPELITVDIDKALKHNIGAFSVEFIRVTHSIPDPAAVCIGTPAGNIVATGDFRLDPEPLDNRPTDITRLKELGDEGVLLLMSDSSYAEAEGRTPTEHTLQDSFYDVIDRAKGRIFVAVFSSNINRTQMIINAAAKAGRKVALDGRSMLGYVEIAVRQGILKVPKGTIIPMQQTVQLPDDRVLIMCTGGQGEPNAALMRMSEGQHKFIKLDKGDTVVISSTPIPGNEISYSQVSDRLSKMGVKLFRHPTYKIDGCGPLHVSGHAKRDELREMIQLIRPKYFIPVHAGALRRKYHVALAIEEGLDKANTLLPDNGDKVIIGERECKILSQVPCGSLLIDQNGTVVDGLVVKDRLVLAQAGIVNVFLRIDGRTSKLVSNPDVIARGFLAMKDNRELINELRSEMRRAVSQRFGRVEPDRFRQELRDHIQHFFYSKTMQSPIVIPVVNIVNDGSVSLSQKPTKAKQSQSDEDRFADMRARLLAKN